MHQHACAVVDRRMVLSDRDVQRFGAGATHNKVRAEMRQLCVCRNGSPPYHSSRSVPCVMPNNIFCGLQTPLGAVIGSSAALEGVL